MLPHGKQFGCGFCKSSPESAKILFAHQDNGVKGSKDLPYSLSEIGIQHVTIGYLCKEDQDVSIINETIELVSEWAEGDGLNKCAQCTFSLKGYADVEPKQKVAINGNTLFTVVYHGVPLRYLQKKAYVCPSEGFQHLVSLLVNLLKCVCC